MGMGTLYSFSKLETLNNCKRSFYYTYVLGYRNGENLYSFLGSIVHNLIECLELSKLSIKQAKEMFCEAIRDLEIMELKWINSKVKENYISCVLHYIENFQPTICDEIHIEEYFEFSINNNDVFRGYIDKWYKNDNDIYIVDYKTSSKYSKKEFNKKKIQLYIYYKFLNNKYPKSNFKLCFDMVKYAYQNKKLIERNKINLLKEFAPGVIAFEYSEEDFDTTERYITNTITCIDNLDGSKPSDFGRAFNPNLDFFCKNLCTHRNRCLNYEN